MSLLTSLTSPNGQTHAGKNVVGPAYATVCIVYMYIFRTSLACLLAGSCIDPTYLPTYLPTSFHQETRTALPFTTTTTTTTLTLHLTLPVLLIPSPSTHVPIHLPNQDPDTFRTYYLLPT